MRVLLRKAEDHLRSAQIDQSADVRFETAYTAARLLCTVVLRAAGYRVVASERHHQITIEALPQIMGPAQLRRAEYYDECRRRRGDVTYQAIPSATEREVQDLVQDLQRFRPQVEAWLRERHPDLMR